MPGLTGFSPVDIARVVEIELGVLEVLEVEPVPFSPLLNVDESVLG